MSTRVSNFQTLDLLSFGSIAPTADADVLIGADTKGSRGVLVAVVMGTFNGYHATGFARMLLRHSDHASSGYAAVPLTDIEGEVAPLGAGNLFEQKEVIATGDQVIRTYSYIGAHRYLAVRADLHGGITGAPISAFVLGSTPRQHGP